MNVGELMKHLWHFRYRIWSFAIGLYESRRILVTTVYGTQARKWYDAGRKIGGMLCLILMIP